MFKKFFSILLLLMFCMPSATFAAETFVYGDFIYSIDLVSGEDDISLSLALNAVQAINLESFNPPPASIVASDIYEALGYDSSDAIVSDIGTAIYEHGDSSISVLNALTFGAESETELTSDSLEEANASAPAEIDNEIKVVLVEELTFEQIQVSFPDQKPMIVNDRTLIPARGLFEEMGYTVEWDGETSTAIVTNSSITIKIPIDSNVIYRNNQPVEIDVPAQIINSRTMLPLRAISEAMNLTVEWDNSTRSALIYY